MGKKSAPAEHRATAKMGKSSSPDLQQRIAERAYELHVARGCQQGRDLDDWLEAERELAAAA